MTSNTKLNQINSNEIIQKVSNDNIAKDEIEKLNILFDDKIDLDDFISKKIKGFEGLEFNCNINKNNKNLESERIEKDKNKDKRRQKAIYELLNFYKKANCDKSSKFKLSPFKPLIKPKIIQMNKRILLNIQEN